MRQSLLVAFFCLLAVQVAESLYRAVPPEANYNFTEFVNSLNYPVEEHDVVTADGYILTFYRIQAKNSQIRSGLQPVLVNHGLLDSSDSWIINVENQAPGFMLANAGFDVWFANNRGNKYSLGHVDPVNFNSSDSNSAFWDYSWQEMSEYDLPAGLQYVAQQTGKTVHYMGHSEGTTIMFAALSRRDPTIISSLGKFIALAPAVFVQHSTSVIVEVGGWMKAGTVLKELDTFLDRKKFGWMTQKNRNRWETICSVAIDICIERVRLLSDAKTSVDNTSRFPITSGHYPAGSSVQNMYYWSQMFNNPDFSMYDYGHDTNIQVYGTPNPPVYDLSKITEPVHMFVGNYDELAPLSDTSNLRSKLTGSSSVEYRTYELGHASFIWGKDTATYVNDVISVLNS